MEENKNQFNLKNIFLIINVCLMMFVVLGDICYMAVGGLLVKGFTSGFFVLLGLSNLIYLILNKNKDYRFPAIMLTGLVFAMLGDIILNIEFIVGALLFAIGHVFFFIAYAFIFKFKWIDLAFGFSIFVPAISFITLVPIFDFGGILMEIVCIVYALIISCMVGKALSNLIRERNTLNLIILIGSILFFFSDLMLLLNVFGSLGKAVDILCIATYYPAEIFLAFSIFMHKDKKQIEPEKQNP